MCYDLFRSISGLVLKGKIPQTIEDAKQKLSEPLYSLYFLKSLSLLLTREIQFVYVDLRINFEKGTCHRQTMMQNKSYQSLHSFYSSKYVSLPLTSVIQLVWVDFRIIFRNLNPTKLSRMQEKSSLGLLFTSLLKVSVLSFNTCGTICLSRFND